MKREINTSKAPRPAGPYSQAIVVGKRIYVAGQGPLNPETGEIVGTTVEEQTKLTLEHIKTILAEAGATMDHVVKSTVHLSDLRHFAAFNGVYETYFNRPYPVRTTVGSQLAVNMLVEIDVVAELE
jgi:2-iminobutanoate/2-iminopropanoate deaminase